MSSNRLKNKVCIVTGAAQGIGLATALKFAREGAHIAIWDLKQAGIDDAVRQCRELGVEAIGHVVDVTQRAMVDAAVKRVNERFGRIDVLVNNAGITADGKMVSIDKATGELKFMSLERWNRVLQVNLDGAFICSQAVLKYMVPARSGCLLFASSIASTTGNVGQGNYVASKKALIGLSETYARELGPFGIQSNAVLPGFTKTPMIETVPDKVLDSFIGKTPLGRLVDPGDIANAYVWLASLQACSITGISLPVDCGLKL